MLEKTPKKLTVQMATKPIICFKRNFFVVNFDEIQFFKEILLNISEPLVFR